MHMIAIIAQCMDCDWIYEKRNALAVAAAHSKKYAHEVCVDVTYSHYFGKHDVNQKQVP